MRIGSDLAMIGKPIEYQTLTQAQVDEACKRHDFLMSGRMGGARANFSYKILKGLNLSGRNLADADLSGAVLEGCNLAGANLTRAVLFAADLRRANLAGAVLHRADMRGAVLRGSDLTGADLSQADLREGAIAQVDREKGLAVLTHEQRPGEASHASFARANLSQTKMSGAVAQSADFSDAVLIGARLTRANLRSSRFPGANLEGADLQGADLTDADLRMASLRGADLRGADLAGCHVERTLLLGADLVKDAVVLERAYHDADHVTESFNLNLLSRIRTVGLSVANLTRFGLRGRAARACAGAQAAGCMLSLRHAP